MMARTISLIALACFSLVACGDEPNAPEDGAQSAHPTDAAPHSPVEVVRDVQFFLDNPEEREALYADCRNNPGALGDTPECINILDARSEAMRQGMRQELQRNQ